MIVLIKFNTIFLHEYLFKKFLIGQLKKWIELKFISANIIYKFELIEFFFFFFFFANLSVFS